MVLRQRLMEQMESRMQVEDEELRDLTDRHGDSRSGRRGVSAVKRAALFEKRAV